MSIEKPETPSQRPISDKSIESSDSQYVKYLRENGFPNLENLNLTMYFGGHRSVGDATDLAPHLKDIDVFLTELSGHTEDTSRIYNSIAQGSLSPQELTAEHRKELGTKLFADYENTLLAALHASHVRVGFADVPLGAAEGDDVGKAAAKWNTFFNETLMKQWSRIAARQILQVRLQRFAEALVARERYTANEIPRAIARTYETDQNRTDVKSLRVLMSMGANHPTLYKLIQGMHPPVSQIQQPGMTEKKFVDELITRHMAGEKITDELADSALIEEMMHVVLELPKRLEKLAGTDNLNAQGGYLRRLVESMNHEEREAFFNSVLKDDERVALDKVLKMISRKNLIQN